MKGISTQNPVDRSRVLLAPNGEPSNLPPELYAYVRTPEFKQWFGDWELPFKTVDVVLADNHHGFKNFREATKWAIDNIARTYNDEETGHKGEIRISAAAIHNYLSSSSVDRSDSNSIHLAVLKVLPQIIQTSYDAEIHKDYKKDEKGVRNSLNGYNPNVMIHRLYGAANIENEIFRVKVTLKTYKDLSEKTKAYSYEATKIELLEGSLRASMKGTLPRTTDNSISLANLLKNVEKSYEKGEKLIDHSRIVDENGEPLVLYRGQMSHANVPFVNHGDGIYFTPDRQAAIGYGADDDPIPVFLNARNPYEVDFEGDSDIDSNDYHADVKGEYHYAVEEDFDILIATNTFDGEHELDQYVVIRDDQIRRIDTLDVEGIEFKEPYKDKIQDLIAKQQKNLADVSYLDLDFVTKIVKNFENPKLYDEKLEWDDDLGVPLQHCVTHEEDIQSKAILTHKTEMTIQTEKTRGITSVPFLNQEETNSDSKYLLKEQLSLDSNDIVLRDKLISILRSAGINVSTDWEEGQRILDADIERKAKLMGTTTRKRQEEIGVLLSDKSKENEQQVVVDVFSGKSKSEELTLMDANGKTRVISFVQGNDVNAGVKHSVFRHYGTDENCFTAVEVLLIPDVVREGKRSQDGKRVSYSLDRDNLKYTVTTEMKGKGERFTNFFTNRKPIVAEQGMQNTEKQRIQPHQSVSSAKLQKVLDTSNFSQEIFVSNALFAVERIRQERATPQQWLSMLQNAGGIKSGEDKWLGLSEWLQSCTEPTLEKQDILDYVSEHRIQIEEESYSVVEDSSEFKGLSQEFLDTIDSVDQLYDEADRAYGVFLDRMENKYGKGYDVDYDLSAEERDEDEKLLMSREDYVWEDLQGKYDIAFRLMEEKYHSRGFSLAFDHAGDRLLVFNREAAEQALGINPIEDTRLRYTTQNLEHKQEIALIVPFIESWNYDESLHFGDAGDGRSIAWVRFGETLDKDNKHVLVIDEIQSQRHQEGRMHGYYDSKPYLEYMNYRNHLSSEYPQGWSVYNDDARRKHLHILTEEEYGTLDRLNEAAINARRNNKDDKMVPDAPFAKNWHELAMKRMLRYAAENGYDKIAWTKGSQQAERYDLSHKVDEVRVTRINSKTYMSSNEYEVWDIGKYEVEGLKEGKRIFDDYADEKGLSELVGKSLADKIVKGEDTQTYKDEDLHIGGHGMEVFYDQMLPHFMDKYGKKWGVKTHDVELPYVEESGRHMHGVDVTLEMKQGVLEGQPMFFRTEKGDAYGFTKDDKIYIDPRIATSETPVHEYAHLWAQAMRRANEAEWKNIVGLMRGEDRVWKMVQSQYKELKTDDDIAEEVLAQYSGERGMDRLKKELKAYNGTISDEESQGILERIKAAIDLFWEKTADFLHIHYRSADEVANRVMHDLLKGVNPRELSDRSLDGVSLMETINKHRVENNLHTINDRNELTYDEKQTQQKAWRAVFQSLSEENSSDPRRHAEAPVPTYSASKPLFGANLGKLRGITGQLNVLLRQINEKDLSRNEFINNIGGALGLRLEKDHISRYSEEPLMLWNGDKVSFRISNHPSNTLNFIFHHSNVSDIYGLVLRDEGKNIFRADDKVDYLELDYSLKSIDNANMSERRALYSGIINGIKFLLEEGSLEMMPFPDHLNASGRYRPILQELRKEHQEMMFQYVPSQSESVSEEKSEAERIAEYNRRFNEELQKQIDGTLEKGHIYNLGKPGVILQSAGFPEHDIELSATRLALKSEQVRHPYHLEDIKDLVVSLNNPVAVFIYGKVNRAQNVIIEQERDGKNFLTGVHFNQERHGCVVSDIRGLFNKDNEKWLNWIAQGKLLYANKDKIQTVIDKQRTNLAEVDYLDLDFVTKIIKNFENPKLYDEKLEWDDDFGVSLQKDSPHEEDIHSKEILTQKTETTMQTEKDKDFLQETIGIKSKYSEAEQKPYKISYGEFPGMDNIFGDVHVDFGDKLNALDLREVQQMADEYGGEARVMKGSIWADFTREQDAINFAERMIEVNHEKELKVKGQMTNSEEILQKDAVLSDVMEKSKNTASSKPDSGKRSKEDEALDRFADLMIEKIESIQSDWQKPWFTKGAMLMPVNMDNRHYNGFNSLMLMFQQEKEGYKLPVWATFNRITGFNYEKDKHGSVQDAKDRDGNKLPPVLINKGEKSFPVFLTTFTVVDRETKEKIKYDDYKNMTSEEKEKYNVYPKLHVYNVFNLAQTNLKEARPEVYQKYLDQYTLTPDNNQQVDFAPIDTMIKENLWICPIKPIEGDNAYYSISKEEIVIPEKKQFKDGESFYSNLFHEMAHSTGAEYALDRLKPSSFGSADYAKEELVAELTAALTASKYGMEKNIKSDSAAYIKNWLSTLKEDPSFIKTALTEVKKAHTMIDDRVQDVSKELDKGILADFTAIRAKNDQMHDYTPDFTQQHVSSFGSGNQPVEGQSEDVKEDRDEHQEESNTKSFHVGR